MAAEKPLWTILFVIAVVVGLVFFIMQRDPVSAGVCALFALVFLTARGQAAA